MVKFTVTLELMDVSADTLRAFQDALGGDVEFEYGDEWLDFEAILADWLVDLLPEDANLLTASVKVDRRGLKLPKLELPDMGIGGGAQESIAPSATITQTNVASSSVERPSTIGVSAKSSAWPRTSRSQPRQRLKSRRRAGK
jgi:hypothetical protein